MFDWTSDPDTLWLNMTNAILGLCVLICVVTAAMAIGRDILANARARAAKRQVFVYDSHSLMVPELGLTMADGGEPVSEEHPEQKKQS